MFSYSDFWSKLASLPTKPVRIAFTDPSDPRVRDACQTVSDKALIEPVLVKDFSEISEGRLREILSTSQKKQNPDPKIIDAQLRDPLYHGIGLLLEGKVLGLVGGSTRPTSDIVRAALQCVGPRPGAKLVSGQFFIETEKRMSADQTPFLFADCAVMPEPSPRALAIVATSAAESFRFFTGKTPRVAFLSFSTRDSAQSPLVDRIKEALEITRKLDANLIVDGELQVDAALDADVALIKNAADSPVAGKANVFVFPTLEAGNIGYKLVQRFSNARIAGPLLWGLNKPVSDLSRGCTVQEIIDSALCVAMMAKRAI